jgi:hypothetical protein
LKQIVKTRNRIQKNLKQHPKNFKTKSMQTKKLLTDGFFQFICMFLPIEPGTTFTPSPV